MDYAYFENLPQAEAQRELADFLRESEAALVGPWLDRAANDGVASVVAFFDEVAGRISVVQVDPPQGVPAFIVDAMNQHHGGFRDFSNESDRRDVLLAAFFMGEAFVRQFPTLKWALGREGRAEVRQPVVTGFSTGDDLPVLEVAENLLLRHERAKVETAIRTWATMV